MIELRRKKLAMSFPEVHAKATLSVDFQRTLRIPDDGRDYPLPPGLGSFPIRHVDDHAARLPGFLSFGKGLVASLTLVTVIIIMNEFTQGTPLLPTLDVTTFGAAVAAGMLIQWLGHKYYLPLISGEANAPAPMPTSGGSVAKPATPDVMTEVAAPRSMAVGGSGPILAPTGQADPAEGDRRTTDDDS